ncbi:putative serine dehydratase domain-containing protein [Chaetomidium leptoderma]|uniref:D-serine dehydratase n=1 Tax=Chaetomidium leptoderma TaxID=669021 RepID=A0AAN6VJ14_9PEZI|nr:putative serine dehydratase domain-containing protein [Chaetomidium leptoderma]
MATLSSSTGLKEQLRARFAGKTLNDVPTPSVVLDLAKLEVNCERMLEATERLGLLWRAHIKSHKTTELTRLQVGDTLTTPVSLIVSTLTEAENILPLLQEYQSRGRPVNILYSFPLFPTAAPRLAALTSALGPNSLSVMIDHPSQLTDPLATIASTSTTPGTGTHPAPQVFLKIDTSYGRAGVRPNTPACDALVDAALAAEQRGLCTLHGVYSHAGHSYAARQDGAQAEDDVWGYLAAEFRGLAEVARLIERKRGNNKKKGLVLSVGATPTATVVQQRGFVVDGALEEGSGGGEEQEAGRLVRELMAEGFQVEVHAGVYPTLDMQQLATHARDSSLMTADDIAISVVAEVASVYPGRGANGTTEALINAGTLALGREPVADKGKVPGQDYPGWGFLMPWGLDNPVPGPDFPRVHDGWQVGRISQEHGILTWQGKKEDEVPLQYGQRVRVWPNHSCISGAGFDWYLIVDSRNKGREDEVVDVWPRWRGW